MWLVTVEVRKRGNIHLTCFYRFHLIESSSDLMEMFGLGGDGIDVSGDWRGPDVLMKRMREGRAVLSRETSRGIGWRQFLVLARGILKHRLAHLHSFIHSFFTLSLNPLSSILMASDDSLQRTFHRAIAHQDLRKVMELAQVDATLLHQPYGPLGQTALHRAARCNAPEIVSFLLDAKVAIDQGDSDNETALMRASSWGASKTAVLLLQARAQLNLQDNRGDTALMKAASTGKLELVELLLEYGADRNIRGVRQRGRAGSHRSVRERACAKPTRFALDCRSSFVGLT